jgi:hypothetical protein
MSRFSPLNALPYRVLQLPPTVRPRRTDFPGVFRPSNDITQASPVWDGLSVSIPVPLSGFLTSQRFPSRPEFAALLRAATVPGFLSPSEVSLHRNRASLSRSLTPLQLSTELRKARYSSSYHPWFHRTPGPKSVCLVPPRTMELLSTDRVRFPSSLDLEHLSCLLSRHHLLRSFSPPVNPFSPVECLHPLEADPLLDFLLFRAFSSSDLGFSTHSIKAESALHSAVAQECEDLKDLDAALIPGNVQEPRPP